MVTTTRTCGFAFTTTGRPCANRVADGVPWCRAGHPRPDAGGRDDDLATALDRTGVRPAQPRSSGARRSPNRNRRATELLRQAMAAEDAEQFGLRAEHVIADGSTALTLLGDPEASPAARAAVVQRFGRIGALLVLGYEDRWARRRRLAGSGATPAAPAAAGQPVERIVRDFARLDARHLYHLLAELDREDGLAVGDTGADAHRWLHATYAVAARDGTPGAHHAYMRALDDVMRLARPLLAS